MSTSKQSNRHKNLLSINAIDMDIKEEFVKHAKEVNITQGELFKKLWHNYQNFYIPLEQEEQELVNRAYTVSSKTMNKKLKKALLHLAEKVLELQTMDASAVVDKDTKNSSRAADMRVTDIVNEMMLANNTATEWYDRRFLSQRAIFDYALDRKFKDPSNLSLSISVISRFIDSNKDMLDEHHSKYGLDENHNRKAHYERMRIATNVK
jgi:hypothetical protein